MINMYRLISILGFFVIGCSESQMNPMAFEDCECGLEISSTLPYNETDESYELEYNAELSQTYASLDASTNCGWSQRLMWDSNYMYQIDNEWVSLVNPSSMTDGDGNARVILAVWEEFIGYRITIICGYTDEHGDHFVDSLHVRVVNNI